MKTWINGEIIEQETELEHIIDEKVREEIVENTVEFLNEETGEIETKTYEEVIEVPYTEARLVDTGVPITEPQIAYSPEDYPALVETLIRQKYSLSEELAIQRQRDVKTEEFGEYYSYCEECKIKAKALCNMED